MATHEGGAGGPRALRQENDATHAERDSSSHEDVAAPPQEDTIVDHGIPNANEMDVSSTSTCPWRTAQYHDQECSRYFDCPRHQIERIEENTDMTPIGNAEGNTTGSDQNVSNRGSHAGNNDIGRGEGDEMQPAVTPIRQGTNLAELPGSTSRRASQQSGSAPRTEFNFNEPPGSASRRASQQSDSAPRTEFNFNDHPSAASPASTSAGPVLPSSASASNSGAISLLDALTNVRPSSDISPRPGLARSGPSEIALPRWQPDSEVTYCPICHTQFSIFVRKHHCRKCGRVVCNSCSPHRITIPYQYIVQPPGYAAASTQRYPPVSGSERLPDFASLGGGERVRLCNPCVPDPNTAPPQSPSPVSATYQRSSGNPLSSGPAVNRSDAHPITYTAPGNDPFIRNRSVTMQSIISASSQSQASRSRGGPALGGTSPAFLTGSSSSYQGTARSPNPLTQNLAGHGIRNPSAAGPSSAAERSLPPLPQLAEEDECPICHRELPRRTLPNYEALREGHINICITAHSTYGSPRTATLGTAVGDGAPLPRIPPRMTRMFPYIATEKDCVDSAECSICLEEFEVGESMARLECLCRFHRHCIAAWWERHPGRCPMHQHDSYGF